eukprot:3988995-Pyramimonas_sp.AAC.1
MTNKKVLFSVEARTCFARASCAEVEVDARHGRPLRNLQILGAVFGESYWEDTEFRSLGGE